MTAEEHATEAERLMATSALPVADGTTRTHAMLAAVYHLLWAIYLTVR